MGFWGLVLDFIDLIGDYSFLLSYSIDLVFNVVISSYIFNIFYYLFNIVSEYSDIL